MKVVKVGAVNAMGRTDGCARAPAAILERAKEVFLNESFCLVFVVVSVSVARNDVEETNSRIFAKSREVFKKLEKGLVSVNASRQKVAGERVVFLGGDHSISYSVCKGFFENFPLGGLVVFDAHADCVNSFKPPTHEDWLRMLIEEKVVRPERIVVVGLRNVERGELRFLKARKVNFFTCKEIFESGLKDFSSGLMEVVRGFGKFYVSFDVDFVDPRFVPGTGYVEPGGFSSREAIFLIQKLGLLDGFVGGDIVEVNPTKEKELSVGFAAKLLGEFC